MVIRGGRVRPSGRLGSLLALALAIVFATLTVAAPRAEAALPATCDPSTVFNLAGLPTGGSSPNAGNIYALNVSTGQNTLLGSFGSGSSVALNGLGVASDLRAAYAVTQSGGTTIWTHTQGGANSSVSASNTGMTMVMGAVDPSSGIYYYAGYTGFGSGLTLAIFGYNPATRTPLGRLVNVSMAGTGFSTGDLAFDGNGNAFIVAGTLNTAGVNTWQVRRVDGPLPTAGPTVTRPSTTLATHTSPAASGFYNGIAFAAGGTLYAQYATTGSAVLETLNPNTGAVVASINQGNVPAGIVFTDLAGCSLPGTLTVHKDLPDGRAGADDQFTMTVVADGITAGNTVTTTGTASGVQEERLGPLPGIPSTRYTVSETLAQSTTTSLDAYTSSWTCLDTNPGSTFSASGPGTTFTLDFPPPDTGVLGARIDCTFTNTPVEPRLTLTKMLGGEGRDLDSDQFTMQIHTGSPDGPVEGDTDNATTAGTGATVVPGTGTTTLDPATPGTTYYLTQSGAGTTNLADYTQDIECTDKHGVQTGLIHEVINGSATVTPMPGADISCILTNAPVAHVAHGEPLLQLEKQLGSNRVRDTDQFTVQIRPDSPDGEPLPPVGAADPTTAGAGATVSPGTGTTGETPLELRGTYYLTETAAGSPLTDLDLYTASVTCEDLTGQQTDLPENVPLGEHPSITPTNPVSVIHCIVTNTAVQPTLTLHKALGGARANAGDQFTVQIRADDQTTVVGDTTAATTQGTGAAVDPGTGTTSLSADTAGHTFHLGDLPADGTPTDPRQYSSTITCTDVNGVQNGLPDDQPHAGLFEIAPRLGAAITCTITNTPIPPGLRLDKALGSARIRDTDQFTMQIKDAAGTVVGSTDDATTTGTGSVVDPGTGTTVRSPANSGEAYTLTEAPTGTTGLGAYSATITCTDDQELQPDLPVDAAFTGSTTIVPVVGASIACTVTNTAQEAPRLELVKSVDPATVSAAGQTVTYTFVVTNTGDTAVHGLVLDETAFSGTGMPTAITCRVTTLAPGEHTTCTATYQVTQADIEAGGVTNTAVANGTTPGGEQVASPPASAELSAVQAPALELVKSVDPAAVSAPGQTVTYTFVVTNTGNITLHGIRVDETAFSGTGSPSAITCPVTTLAPGERTTCTATYTVTPADIDNAGRLTNTAVATGELPSGEAVASEPSTTTVTVGRPEIISGVPDSGSGPDTLRVAAGLALMLMSGGALAAGLIVHRRRRPW